MPSDDVMPAVFFGHGTPMNALETNRYTEAWSAFGASVPRPRAILSISAHWFINASAVTAMAAPRTIHDFFGFPDELFALQYPAPGDPDLAGAVQRAADPVWIGRDEDSWGLDHGTWSVLVHAFPAADVPVVQLALDGTKPLQYHLELGARLAPLREEGVLIMASGNTVHHLGRLDWSRPDAGYDWAVRFGGAVADRLLDGDPAAVARLDADPDFALAAPTPDHFLPVLYLAGLAMAAGEHCAPLVEGFAFGSLSMDSFTLGCTPRGDLDDAEARRPSGSPRAEASPGCGPGVVAGALGSRPGAGRVAAGARGQRLDGADVAGGVVRAGPAGVVRADRGRGAPRRRRGRAAARRGDGARRADHPRPRLGPAAATPAGADPHRRGDVVPAVQRARRRLGPGRPHDPRRARRRRVGRHRAEGLDDERAPRRLRDAAGPHRLGRPQAPRPHLLRAADAPARHRGPTPAPDERPRVVQRGLPRRRAHPGRPRRGRGRRRLGGRAHDAGPRAAVRRGRRRARCGRRAGPGRRRVPRRGRRPRPHLPLVPAAGRPPGPPRAAGRRGRSGR